MILTECPTCGIKRRIRPDRAGQTCGQCRKRIPEPTDREALKGGAWLPHPVLPIVVWVADEEAA